MLIVIYYNNKDTSSFVMGLEHSAQVMTEYVNITGDWGGVDGTPGNLSGRCYENYFWLAPGCRADASLCLVYVTGGNGWGMWETLVKATSYNMPLATAVASNSSSYSLLPTLYSTLFYWWVPDPRFLRPVISGDALIFQQKNSKIIKMSHC